MDVIKQGIPVGLISLLECEYISKAGRNVSGDCKRLMRDYGHIRAFTCKSLIELGSFCKDRKLIEDGRASLQTLCALILRKHLAKDLRLSDWTLPLTSERINYCAMDALASLQVYNTTVKASNLAVCKNDRGALVLYIPLGCIRPVAKARICIDQPDRFLNFRVGMDRAVVEILEICAPSYRPKLSNTQGLTLAEMGEAPFQLLV
jgi:hypothetical protein